MLSNFSKYLELNSFNVDGKTFRKGKHSKAKTKRSQNILSYISQTFLKEDLQNHFLYLTIQGIQKCYMLYTKISGLQLNLVHIVWSTSENVTIICRSRRYWQICGHTKQEKFPNSRLEQRLTGCTNYITSTNFKLSKYPTFNSHMLQYSQHSLRALCTTQLIHYVQVLT